MPSDSITLPPATLARGEPDWNIVNKVCASMSEGKALKDALTECNGFASATWYDWLGRSPEVARAYAQARERRCDAIFEETMAIANTPQAGKREVVKTTDKGTWTEVMTVDMIEHRRLQVDTRKWFLAKLDPGKYGDQVRIEHAGAVTLTAAMVRERLAGDADVKAMIEGRKGKSQQATGDLPECGA